MKVIRNLFFAIGFVCFSECSVNGVGIYNNCKYVSCSKISYCEDVVIYLTYEEIILIIDGTDMIRGFKIEIPEGRYTNTQVGFKRPLSINAKMSTEEIKKAINDISYKVKISNKKESFDKSGEKAGNLVIFDLNERSTKISDL